MRHLGSTVETFLRKRVVKTSDGAWNQLLSEDDFVKELMRREGVWWSHDGNVSKPHVGLEGNECSDSYFNMEGITSNAQFSEMMAIIMVAKFEMELGLEIKADWVVGSSFAKNVAGILKAKFISIENGTVDPRVKEIGVNDVVFQIENVVTDRREVKLTRKKIGDQGARFLRWFPVVGILAYRPLMLLDATSLGDQRCLTVLNHPQDVIRTENCPLCRGGSERLDPKKILNF